MAHLGEESFPVGHFVVEVVGKVGRTFVCFGESGLDVVEVSNGAGDSEMHGPQLPNQAFQGFPAHATS